MRKQYKNSIIPNSLEVTNMISHVKHSSYTKYIITGNIKHIHQNLKHNSDMQGTPLSAMGAPRQRALNAIRIQPQQTTTQIQTMVGLVSVEHPSKGPQRCISKRKMVLWLAYCSMQMIHTKINNQESIKWSTNTNNNHHLTHMNQTSSKQKALKTQTKMPT